MPSAVVGGAERRKWARNCTPCVRSLTHRPLACTNSPAPMVAAPPLARRIDPGRRRWIVLRSGLFTGFDLGGIARDAADQAVTKGALDQRFVHPLRQLGFSELMKRPGKCGLAGHLPPRWRTRMRAAASGSGRNSSPSGSASSNRIGAVLATLGVHGYNPLRRDRGRIQFPTRSSS
jgi:hypothetical protein